MASLQPAFLSREGFCLSPLQLPVLMISVGARKQVKIPPSQFSKLSAPSGAELVWLIQFVSQGFYLNIPVNNARLCGRRLYVHSTPLEYRKACQLHECRFRNSFNIVIYFTNGNRSQRFFSTFPYFFICMLYKFQSLIDLSILVLYRCTPLLLIASQNSLDRYHN